MVMRIQVTLSIPPEITRNKVMSSIHAGFVGGGELLSKESAFHAQFVRVAGPGGKTFGAFRTGTFARGIGYATANTNEKGAAGWSGSSFPRGQGGPEEADHREDRPPHAADGGRHPASAANDRSRRRLGLQHAAGGPRPHDAGHEPAAAADLRDRQGAGRNSNT